MKPGLGIGMGRYDSAGSSPHLKLGYVGTRETRQMRALNANGSGGCWQMVRRASLTKARDFFAVEHRVLTAKAVQVADTEQKRAGFSPLKKSWGAALGAVGGVRGCAAL